MFREDPHSAEWARWSSRTHGLRSDGNLAVVLRGDVDLSIGGQQALDLYAAGIADYLDSLRRDK